MGIRLNDDAERHTFLTSMLLGSELCADAVESYKDSCFFGWIPKELTEVDLVRCVDHIIHSVRQGHISFKYPFAWSLPHPLSNLFFFHVLQPTFLKTNSNGALQHLPPHFCEITKFLELNLV